MPNQALKRQTEVRGYVIRRVLGQGSYGITYLADDTKNNRAVAIKEYFPARFASRDSDNLNVLASQPASTDVEDFDSGLEKFLEESKTLQGFHDKHIVRVLDVFEDNGTAYMVMEYEEGGTLSLLLKAHQEPMSEAEILSIFIPLLEGLRTVHAKWFLHRDIKPDNIYIRKSGSPLFIDFGTARHAVSAKRGGMTEYLTPGFAPPEQYNRQADHGPWTDVYALGATMYYCVTRVVPYEGRFRVVGNDPVVSAVQFAPKIYSEELLKVIDWMMLPDYKQRPQSVDEVLRRLRSLDHPPEPVTTLSAITKDLPGRSASTAPPSGSAQTTAPKAFANAAAPPVKADGGADDATVKIDSEAAKTPKTARRPEAARTEKFARTEPLLTPKEGTIKLPTRPATKAPRPKKKPPEKQSSSAAALVVAGVVVLLGAAGGWFYWQSSGPRSGDDYAKVEPPAPPEPAPTPVQPAEPAPAPVQTEADAAAALEQCASYLRANRGEPDVTRRAMDCYRKVLDRFPENPEAMAMVTEMAEDYVVLARKAIESGSLDEAGKYLGQARQSMPGSAEVRELETALDTLKQDLEQKRIRLALLTNQCDARVQSDITSDAGALACYRRILEEFPGNEDATAAIQNIEADFLATARVALDNEDVKGAQETMAKLQKANLAPSEWPELEAKLKEVNEKRLRPGRQVEDALKDGAAGPTMVVIPAGQFMMGCSKGPDCGIEKQPAHRVFIDDPFLISRHEVSFAQYDRFAKSTDRPLPEDAGWGRGERPVINVSHADAVAYTAWLSEQTGEQYRLPSEAEWEYAARANSQNKYFFGDDDGQLCQYANLADASTDLDWRNPLCKDGAAQETAKVASYAANTWGVHDAIGNVWEWVADCWHENYTGAPGSMRPWLDVGNGDCQRRVIRGGSWYDGPKLAYAADRTWAATTGKEELVGFRVVRTLD